jgi:hypothetical protein
MYSITELVATDTIFSDSPAIDGGATACQIFAGTDSTVLDAYGMKTDAQFVNTVEDNNCFHGAPTHLISNNAQAKTSNCVKDILCILFIPSWKSIWQRKIVEMRVAKILVIFTIFYQKCTIMIPSVD